MARTPNLELSYLEAAQAQKHVTHNEALRALDALVQISVRDRDLNTPPSATEDGDRYLVADGGLGGWTGRDGQLAVWQDGAWAFHTPQPGWLIWVEDENSVFVWSGTSWHVVGGGSGAINPADLVGVNAVADVTNRLSVSSPASLFNHDGGDHRQVINKAVSTDTASQVYQTGFSARAEVGLAGDDDFHFKVSADGTLFRDAIVISHETGGVSFPHSTLHARENLLINGDFQINQRVFAGGALAAQTYGYDRWKSGTTGADLSVVDDVVSLASGEVVQVLEAPSLAGKTVTVSVSGLDGGDLLVDVGGAAGTLANASGVGVSSISVDVPQSATGNISFRLSPASGAVNFRTVKLEVGADATPFLRRAFPLELAMCQRYFERVSGIGGANRLIRRGFGNQTGFQFSTVSFSTLRVARDKWPRIVRPKGGRIRPDRPTIGGRFRGQLR